MTGLNYCHLLLVVDVYLGEQGDIFWVRLPVPTPYYDTLDAWYFWTLGGLICNVHAHMQY